MFCFGLLGSAFICLGLISFFLSLEAYLDFEKPLERAGAIVLMAGDPQERLTAASFLFKQRRAPKIILTNDGVSSSWSKLFQRNLYEVEWAEQKLIKAGVPEHAIVKLPYTSSGTYYDAKHALEYALDSKLNSLIIVTSDYHTKRSYWTFRQIADERDIEFGTYPTYSTKLFGDSFYLTCKRAKRLFIEFMKFIYYQMKYGF